MSDTKNKEDITLTEETARQLGDHILDVKKLIVLQLLESGVEQSRVAKTLGVSDRTVRRLAGGG